MVYQDIKKDNNPSVSKYILVIFLLYIYFNSVYFRFLGEFVSQHILIPVVLICYNRRMFSFIKMNKKLLWFYFILLFVTTIITIRGGDNQPFKNAIMKMAYYMYVPSILIPYICINKLSFSKCVIAVGWISGVVSTLCFMSSSFADMMSALFINNVEGLDQLTVGRTFGIASGITYAYGLVNAFIFAYALSINYYKKKYTYIFYILLLFATVINSRTSFVIELVFAVLYLIMGRSKEKIKISTFMIVVGVIAYFFILPRIIDSDTGLWITQGYYMINDIAFDTNTANSNVFLILQNHIIFPNTTNEWLFGTGEFIYTKSDIGFILQIYYGGLFYLCLLLITYYTSIKPLGNKYMFICALIMLLIANFKGIYLEYNDGLKTITFIAMYCAYSRFFQVAEYSR